MSKIYAISSPLTGDKYVYEVDTNGVYTKIGGQLPMALQDTATYYPTSLYGRVSEIFGAKYAIYGTGIAKLVNNQWVPFYQDTDWMNSNSKSPMYQVNISGIPHIVGCAGNAADINALIFYTINLLTGQAKNSSSNNGGDGVGTSSSFASICVSGMMYTAGTNGGTIRWCSYNPATNEVTSYQNGGVACRDNPVLHWYRNKVILLSHDAGSFLYIYTHVPGTNTFAGPIASAAIRGLFDINIIKHAIISDDTSMYIFYVGKITYTGIRCLKVTEYQNLPGSYTYSDVTSSVIPYRLWYLYDDANTPKNMIFAYQSVEGMNDSYILIHADRNASSYNKRRMPIDLWKWNGPNTYITKISTLSDNSEILSLPMNGGGNFSSYGNGNKIDSIITNIQGSSNGNTTVSFRIIESTTFPIGTNVNIYFEYTNQTGPYPPSKIAALNLGSSTPDGTIINNKITGLTANSGILRTVDIRTLIQGATSGNPIILTPVVELV